MSAPPDTIIQLGGSFLIEHLSASEIFTPEDFSEEHHQIQTTTSRFLEEEVLPRVENLENKEHGLSRYLIEQASALGLCSILVPERCGGLEMDFTSQLIVAEQMGRYASFSTTYGAHAGIGLLPLVFFGDQKQQQHYIPKLISGEWIAAYCLSEAHSGSDALAARTHATLSSNGKHYVLNGEKMWISNGGWADLYTIFAKVDGEHLTAFLVERTMEGVKPGSEERKMGIRGSSTTPVVLENVHVPTENVLGEIGRGHVIAFNILNIGRIKLCASCVGGAKDVLSETIRYAKQRKAFGKVIAQFGLIQHKIAEMAIRIFVTESMVYRISGMIDQNLSEVSWENDGSQEYILGAIEERAIECAIAKVYGSETLDYVVDEGAQIHGGYGFHQDYMVERAYRDARINRIYEGTSEINRLLVTGMLLKRASQGRLKLPHEISKLHPEIEESDIVDDAGDGLLAAERQYIQQIKKVALLTLGVAHRHFGEKIKDEQEVVAAISDLLITIYGSESALLRAEKLTTYSKSEQATEMVRVLVSSLIPQVHACTSGILMACDDESSLQEKMGILRSLTDFTPCNSIVLRRSISQRLLQSERFAL